MGLRIQKGRGFKGEFEEACDVAEINEIGEAFGHGVEHGNLRKQKKEEKEGRAKKRQKRITRKKKKKTQTSFFSTFFPLTRKFSCRDFY